MSVKNLDINPRYIAALLNARVHDVRKILCYSKYELKKKTGLSDNCIKEIFKASAKSICTSSWTSVWGILNKTCDLDYQHQKLTTGCASIDALLHGGIVFPGVTEISGESASGKTQLCLQLCLNAQKSIDQGGINAGALYICTEDAFPTKRLHQMAQEFVRSNKCLISGGKLTQVTDQIYIEHACDLEDLWSLLDQRVHVLLSRNSVKLLVIDSIAALFRTEFNTWELSERSRVLAKFGALLHKLSQKMKLCVVCINQVSDVFNDFSFSVSGNDGSRNVTPALGLTWSYFVNTRLLLSRTQWKASHFTSFESHNQVVPSHDSVVRSLKVVFASHLPVSKSYFTVEKEGIKDFMLPTN